MLKRPNLSLNIMACSDPIQSHQMLSQMDWHQLLGLHVQAGNPQSHYQGPRNEVSNIGEVTGTWAKLKKVLRARKISKEQRTLSTALHWYFSFAHPT